MKKKETKTPKEVKTPKYENHDICGGVILKDEGDK